MKLHEVEHTLPTENHKELYRKQRAKPLVVFRRENSC